MMRPQLAVVVDTEEEFDWSRPLSRDNVGTANVAAQPIAHEVFDRFGVVPTYVVGFPIASDAAAAGVLGALRDQGRAEIGAHLHPWVTPPHDEDVTRFNSYQCNLPADLEHAKIAALTAAVTAGFGAAPTVFKAGRYGFGPNTAASLRSLGYTIDCSYVPNASFADDGGPDYRCAPDQPFWLDHPGGLLEVPLSNGFFGAVAGLGPMLRPIFDSPAARRTHLIGALARSGLISRARLSPEGMTADEQCRLLDALVARGRRVFTLTYHSPSLAPGHTPYVRTAADLGHFLARIESVLGYFRDTLGGEFTTMTRLRADMAALSSDPPRG